MNDTSCEATGLQSFTRPRYFYGQLLDVRHFESEQEYFKRKLRMLNRTVIGYGVVCGLDVHVDPDHHSVIVKPGLALDPSGREIVVPCDSKSVKIGDRPAADQYRQGGPCDDEWVHLVICYREHKANPEPVLAGGCDVDVRCAPGAVREGYELELVPGLAPEISVDCKIPHVTRGNCINYQALVNWVLECHEPSDACVTLANIHLPVAGRPLEQSDINIAVRKIVFGLDLLWQLVLALSHDANNRRNARSQA